MKKGSSGIRLAYLAGFAFLFAIFGQILFCALLMCIGVFLEKDEWLGRQGIQALVLSLITERLGKGFVGAATAFNSNSLTGLGDSIVVILLAVLLAAAVLAGVMGALNTFKEKEANLPLLSGVAYRAYGKMKPIYVPQQPVQQQGYQPQQPPMPGQGSQTPMNPQGFGGYPPYVQNHPSAGNPGYPPQNYQGPNQGQAYPYPAPQNVYPYPGQQGGSYSDPHGTSPQEKNQITGQSPDRGTDSGPVAPRTPDQKPADSAAFPQEAPSTPKDQEKDREEKPGYNEKN